MKRYPLSKLQKEAQHLRLSSTEKAAMHAALMQRVRASGGASVSAPRTTRSPYFFMMPQVAMPFAALLMVVFAGGGTLFASGNALPGDPLYSVKTMVSEPVRGVLAFSDEEKIKYHTEVAQMRLEEAEVLASQNRLEGSAVTQLQTSLDAHLAQREEIAAQAKEKHEGRGDDHVLTDELDSSITAHTEVLAAIGLESSSTTTRENSNTLAFAVRNASSRNRGAAPEMGLMMAKSAAPVPAMAEDTAAPQAMMMTMTAPVVEDTVASSANEERRVQPQEPSRTKSKQTNVTQSRQEKNALALGKRATSSLEELKASVRDLGRGVSENARAMFEARVAAVAELVASGQASLDAKEFGAASESFRQAINEAATLKTFVSANKRFDNGLLGRLLGSNDSVSDERGYDNEGRGRGRDN